MRGIELCRGLGLAAVLVFAGVGAAQAGTCGRDVCWGAVAAGPSGVAARASGQHTAPAAWDRAARVCGGRCETIEVFHSGCGAILQDGAGRLWAGFGTSRALAMADAQRNCGAGGNRSCRVRIWACSQ